MKNYYELSEINQSPNWSYIPKHPHKILTNGSPRLGKTNVLLNLIKHQRSDIYLHLTS